MYDEVSDHELLAGGVHDQVAESAAAARQVARLLVFHDRRTAEQAEEDTRRKAEQGDLPGRRRLTALQETIVEVGELWGLSAGRIRSDLQHGRVLRDHFPGVWQLCLRGHLDGYRASLVADAATGRLAQPDWPVLAERITAWFQRRVRRPGDDVDLPEVVCCTLKQLRNKLSYECTRLRPREADERFKAAFADRRATARLHPHDGCDTDGMGTLTLGHSVDTVQIADYRLTLAAKAMRAQGDPRTLEQLRTDLAMDLLIGRAAIQSPLTELDGIGNGLEPSRDDWVTRIPTPSYARPIVNVTVPIETLMGLSDDPGVLSGGAVIPASLARMIATQPGSTWHRMLTDPAGRCVEVSTTSYKPSRSIWNDVVARWQTCFRGGCNRPATESELDHRVPWPTGATSNRNLQPGCGRDHTAKHTPGFSVTCNPAGDLAFTTKAGFRHPVAEASQATGTSIVSDELLEIQSSATEIRRALEHVAKNRAPRPEPPEWLNDLWEGVA
jgi:hypothetical protein